MAIITCKECGAQISDLSLKCIKCEAPITSSLAKDKNYWHENIESSDTQREMSKSDKPLKENNNISRYDGQSNLPKNTEATLSAKKINKKTILISAVITIILIITGGVLASQQNSISSGLEGISGEEQFSYTFEGKMFDQASDFDCGYAIVKENGRTYFMDTDGNAGFVFPTDAEFKEQYETAGKTFYLSVTNYWGQGLCYVYLADYCGQFVYDTRGNKIEVTGVDAPEAGDPACVNGRIVYHIFDENNKYILGDPYENTIFSGRSLIRLDNVKFAYLDENGKLVFPDYLDFEISDGPIFEEGVWEPEGIVNLIDSEGSYILNPDGSKFTIKYGTEVGSKENMYCFKNGVTAFYNNGVEKYMNDKGEPIDADEYNLLFNLSEGYSVFTDGRELFGYKDSSGKVIVAPQFDYAGPVRNGLACVKSGSHFSYIKIGNPKVDKQELQKEIFLLDNSSQQNLTQRDSLKDQGFAVKDEEKAGDITNIDKFNDGFNTSLNDQHKKDTDSENNVNKLDTDNYYYPKYDVQNYLGETYYMISAELGNNHTSPNGICRFN